MTSSPEEKLDSYDLVIIGAGISGFILAMEIKRQWPSKKIVILEKSKGVGGRCSNKRVGAIAINQGLESFEIPSQFLLNYFKKIAPPEFWIEKENKLFWAQSATALFKYWAKDLNVELNIRVKNISKESRFWKISLDNQKNIQGQQIAIATPLPQALEIISSSYLNDLFKENLGMLQSIKYESEILAILNVNLPPHALNDSWFTGQSSWKLKLKSPSDHNVGLLFSYQSPFVLDQVEIIQREFDAFIKKNFFFHFPDANYELAFHFWRYRTPLNPSQLPFLSHKGLSLIGDSFSGGQFAGAIQSAILLAQALHFNT